jgi:RNA polymerase sigma factor (sigma-70 family)
MAASSPAAARPPTIVAPFRLARFGEERLARLVAGGNDRAFAALYERYHQPLYRYCRSIVRDDPDAQDALQSTFAGALVALRRGQRSAPVRPWLFRIAHNEAVSVLRRRGGEEELSEVSGQSVASAEDQAGDRERFALLMADLRELPERLRGALLMRELGGLSHEEIAIALDTSVGAAKQAIFDARRGLLELAEGRAMACEEIRRSVSDGDGRVLRGRRVRAHLHDCRACASFAAAIPARRGELQALVPVLPPVASAAMLASVIGSGSGHSAGGGAGAVAAGAAGKTVGATIATKTLVGAVLLTSAAIGVTGVSGVLTNTRHRPVAAHERSVRSGPAERPVRPATGTRTPGALRGNATRARRRARSDPALLARRGASATAANPASTTSTARHHGVGAPGPLPSQALGTPARTRGGSSRATVGQHAGGPPASRPVHRKPTSSGGPPASRPVHRNPTSSGGPPASRPGANRSGTARSSHTSAAGASHSSAGSAPSTTQAPPAPVSPSAHAPSRAR